MNYTYDVSKIKLLINTIKVVGFADNLLDIDYQGQYNKLLTGVTGETAWVRDNNNSATIRFRLLQTSQTNILLSALAELNTVFVVVLYFEGVETGVGVNCKFGKLPSSRYSAEVGEFEWEIIAAEWVAAKQHII